jgi:hypothetical protein
VIVLDAKTHSGKTSSLKNDPRAPGISHDHTQIVSMLPPDFQCSLVFYLSLGNIHDDPKGKGLLKENISEICVCLPWTLDLGEFYE